MDSGNCRVQTGKRVVTDHLCLRLERQHSQGVDTAIVVHSSVPHVFIQMLLEDLPVRVGTQSLFALPVRGCPKETLE